MDLGKLLRKYMPQKIKCPQCKNDPVLKKNCIVCRKSGFVWK